LRLPCGYLLTMLSVGEPGMLPKMQILVVDKLIFVVGAVVVAPPYT